MRMSVADAQEFIAVLEAGIASAKSAGQSDFDLTSAAEAQYQGALAEFDAAKAAAAQNPSSGTSAAG